MKKLFASLLAATMVAGMAVSAFAYTNDATTAGKDDFANAILKDTISVSDDDFSLSKNAYNKDGMLLGTVSSELKTNGGKVYFPIIVGDEEFNDAADANSTNDKYLYATKASEVEDIKAKVKATIGGKFVEKEVNVVRKNIDLGNNGKTDEETAKIYCVEVKVLDFADVEEKEIEFDITLYNKNKKQVELEDINFTYGSDAEKILTGADYEGATPEYKKGLSKAPKFKTKDGDLTLYITKDAKAYELDKIGNDDIELITLEMLDADNDATFEVAASSQDDLFLGYSTDANKAIVVANPDADINFLDFDANPTFDFTGTLRLTVEDADKTYFCYEVKDGKVTPVGKYNAEDECFEIRTRTLGSYAISDKELVNAKADEEKPADKPAEEKPADKVVGTGAIA